MGAIECDTSGDFLASFIYFITPAVAIECDTAHVFIIVFTPSLLVVDTRIVDGKNALHCRSSLSDDFAGTLFAKDPAAGQRRLSLWHKLHKRVLIAIALTIVSTKAVKPVFTILYDVNQTEFIAFTIQIIKPLLCTYLFQFFMLHT